MSRLDSDLADKSHPRDNPTLTRLADLIGCPVDDFANGARPPLDVGGASELLTIWAEMDDDGDREKLLEFARKLGAR